ncbi:hypothetical protein PVAP13_6NG254774 [Panicum virgatum]|uniref:Aminotransferase-like plant mobile domain-containing protein n=1 Tax=Panicum virgatum TaxID=38727 RepID=A0A8T0R3C3_PANVG|nr:hypothetical protein PVAP13_6NG254774 [Panicum virgatum]
MLSQGTPLRRSARNLPPTQTPTNGPGSKSGTQPRPRVRFADPLAASSSAAKRRRVVEEGAAPSGANPAVVKNRGDPSCASAGSRRRTNSGRRDDDGAAEDEAQRPCVYRIISYCKPSLVHDTLSSLSDAAKEIVKEVGMGGMLEVPKIMLIDRQFSFWLLTRVSPATLSLQLGNGVPISLDAESVELVLGVRSYGNEVPRATKKIDRNLEIQLARVLQLPEGTRHITTADLSLILERDMPLNPTEADKDMFRAAVALFCFTHLLSPHDRGAIIPREIMYCALYPQTLRFYNWAQFILEVIRDSAEKLHEDLHSEHKTLLLGGCLLYLQVYYLDRIDFGNNNVQSNGYPRIAHYSKEKIRQLIDLDKACDPNPAHISFGATQIARRNSPSDPRSNLASAKISSIRKEASQACRNHECNSREAGCNDATVLTRTIMDRIGEVDSRSRQAIKQAAEEIQRSNATNFVNLDRLIRQRFEALELRVSTTIQGLRQEIAGQLQAFMRCNAPSFGAQQEEGQTSRQGASTPTSKTTKAQAASSSRPPRPNKQTSGSTCRSGCQRHAYEEEGIQVDQQAHSDDPMPHIPDVIPESATQAQEGTLHPSSPPHQAAPAVIRRNYKGLACRNAKSWRCDVEPSDKVDPGSLATPNDATVVGSSISRPPKVEMSKSRNARFHERNRGESSGPLTAAHRTCPITSTTTTSINMLKPVTGRTKHMAKKRKKDEFHPQTSACRDHLMKDSGQTSAYPDENVQPKNASFASPCMPTPKCNRDIVIHDAPELLQVIEPKRIPYSKPPNKLGLERPSIRQHVLERFYQNVAACSQSELSSRIWVSFQSPTPISISGAKIAEHMISQGKHNVMPIDICAALVGMLQSHEMKMYSRSKHARWRHFLPPAWAIHILKCAGASDVHSLMSMFVSESVGYRIEQCRMIIAPVVVAGWWACYIWDMERKELHVLDPVLTSASDVEQNKHHIETINLLHEGLFSCLHSIFGKWNVSRYGWESKYYSSFHKPTTTEYSGYYAIYYAMVFNGKKICKSMFKDLQTRVKKELMYRLVTSPMNLEKLPSFMVQEIED